MKKGWIYSTVVIALTILAMVLYGKVVDHLWASPPVVEPHVKLMNNVQDTYGKPATWYPPKFKAGKFHKSTDLPGAWPYINRVIIKNAERLPYWTQNKMTVRNCMISRWNNPGYCLTENYTPKTKRMYRATSKIYVKCGGQAIIGFIGAKLAAKNSVKAGWWGAGTGGGACLWDQTASKW